MPGMGRSEGDGGRGWQGQGDGFLLLLQTSFLDVKDFKCLSFKVSLYSLSPHLKNWYWDQWRALRNETPESSTFLQHFDLTPTSHMTYPLPAGPSGKALREQITQGPDADSSHPYWLSCGVRTGPIT